jgi:hypothetical protein
MGNLSLAFGVDEGSIHLVKNGGMGNKATRGGSAMRLENTSNYT